MYHVVFKLHALKSQKSNISLKMESAVKKDASGVYFYSPTKTALDMTEVLLEDVRTLFKILISEGKYDYIIVDKPFDLSDIVYEIIKMQGMYFWYRMVLRLQTEK